MMFRIASSPQTVLANIERFPSEIERSRELQNRLAYARAWYAHRDAKGRWQFGPSKFVGYEGLDAKGYLKSAEERDGRRTEAQLQQWFTIVDPSSKFYAELSSALFAFLSKYGKAPSTKMRINVLQAVCNEQSGTETLDPHDVIVDLMMAVAKTLPSPYLKKLRERLNRPSTLRRVG